MLVNLEPYGRLGNRLFLAAHLIAFSRKFSLPILNLGFGEYTDLFPWLEGNSCFAYPYRETGDRGSAQRALRSYRWLERLPWTRRFQYWGDTDWNFDRQDCSTLTEPLSRGRDVLFRAWLFRGPESIVQNRQQILEVFQPGPSLLSAVETQVGLWRQGGPILVGVHVRWEDYRGTDSFIDQPGFAERMTQVRRLWPDSQVRFVLFSSETLPTQGWAGLDVAISPATSPLFDMVAMSFCDFLMGPPSTFSGWASFSRQVPLLVLTQSKRAFSPEDFRIVHG